VDTVVNGVNILTDKGTFGFEEITAYRNEVNYLIQRVSKHPSMAQFNADLQDVNL